MLARVSTVLAFAAAVAAATPAAAEVYKWVDANGRVVYGNMPPNNAKKLQRMDEGTSRVSTIPGVPREQLEREQQRLLEARIARLEDELADIRRRESAPATVAVPVPVPAPQTVLVGSGWGVPIGIPGVWWNGPSHPGWRPPHPGWRPPHPGWRPGHPGWKPPHAGSPGPGVRPGHPPGWGVQATPFPRSGASISISIGSGGFRGHRY